MRKSILPDGTPCLAREFSVRIFAYGDGWEMELYDGEDVLSAERIGTLDDVGHYVQKRFEELVNDWEQ